MTFKKGQSGNPGGRPKRERVLAKVIETVGSIKDENGKPNKRLLAEELWNIVNTRKFNELPISFEQWLTVVSWLASHIDGPISQQVDVDNAGEVVLRIIYDNKRDSDSSETAS